MIKKFIRVISYLLIFGILFLNMSCGGGGGKNSDSNPIPDSTPPRIISSTPSQGDINVSVNTDLTILFSEPMDPLSVNSKTVTLYDNEKSISGIVSYTDNTASFRADNHLDNNKTYTLTVYPNVIDIAGNTIESEYRCSFSTNSELPQNPERIISYSTINSIGIEWDITGEDEEHIATCDVKFKKINTAMWNDAQPLFRVDFRGWFFNEVADKNYDMLSGSILFLEADTWYEIELTREDETTITLYQKTRNTPTKPTHGNTYYVEPGSGGGNGSTDNPFKGFAAARDAKILTEGDTLVFLGGKYINGTGAWINFSGAPDEVDPNEPGKYIVLKAAEGEEVIFDRMVIGASHLWIEGFIFEPGIEDQNAIDVKAAHEDLVILNNTFTGYENGIFLRETKNSYIANNTIEGQIEGDTWRTVWESYGEGIELGKSNGCVVAYNTISRVADGISYPSRNCDIYGNDIRLVSDDGIETDFGYSNVRVWNNIVYNTQENAISFQPQFSSPWYFIGNEFVNGSNLIKANVVDRFFLAHNTIIGWNQLQSFAQVILNSVSRNNLWVTIWDKDAPLREPIWGAFEHSDNFSSDPFSGTACNESFFTATWKTDVDYDGFNIVGSEDHRYGFLWYIDDIKYEIKDLINLFNVVGIEEHGIRITETPADLFRICSFSIGYENEEVTDINCDLKLNNGTSARNAGQPLSNINTGDSPDLGAHDYDEPNQPWKTEFWPN